MNKLSLAVLDIDGTLRVKPDPWIHLNEFLGICSEVQKHKRMFESGQIDYSEWVNLDTMPWHGVSRTRILAALETNPLRPGAKELLEWFSANRIPLVGISAGLDVFNDVLASHFGFQLMKSNHLCFDEDGICTGRAVVSVTEDGKGQCLRSLLAELRVPGEEVVALGDGSADIQLFKEAALSIAVFPSKQKVRDAAQYCIDEGRLDDQIPSLIRRHFQLGS